MRCVKRSLVLTSKFTGQLLHLPSTCRCHRPLNIVKYVTLERYILCGNAQSAIFLSYLMLNLKAQSWSLAYSWRNWSSWAELQKNVRTATCFLHGKLICIFLTLPTHFNFDLLHYQFWLYGSLFSKLLLGSPLSLQESFISLVHSNCIMNKFR